MALNAVPLPLFFGIQVLLGTVPAILALLLRGGWGPILVGAIGSLQTWRLWGHPWAIVIFTAELTWLAVAMHRLGGPGHDEHGRVVLADIAFWIVLGTPLVLLFYAGVLGIDTANVLVVALKQSLNGVLNSALAFLLVLLLRAWQASRGGGQAVSLRGIIVALVLTAVLVPTLATTVLVGRQLQMASERGEREALRIAAAAVAMAPRQSGQGWLQLPMDGDLAFRLRRNGAVIEDSDPALFQRLDRGFLPARDGVLQAPELQILVPRGETIQLRKWVRGFWSVRSSFDSQGRPMPGRSEAPLQVQVVQSAADTVLHLQTQTTHMLVVTTVVVLLGALLSAWMGWVCEREFRRVLAPLQQAPSSTLLPTLHLSMVAELRGLARLVNQRIERVQELTGELDRLSVTDPLTGCLNRRALARQLPEAIEACRGQGRPLTVLAIDLDHFKVINDNHGHAVGDHVLAQTVACLRGHLRQSDPLFRQGGEEFLAVLSGCDPERGQSRGEAVRQALERLRLAVPGHGELRVSVSIGVAALAEGDDAPALLGRADQALYRAKQHGRNRVEIF